MSDDVMTGGQATRARLMAAEKRITDLEAQLRALVELVGLIQENQSKQVLQFGKLTDMTLALTGHVKGNR
jgi:hypothetical protein